MWKMQKAAITNAYLTLKMWKKCGRRKMKRKSNAGEQMKTTRNEKALEKTNKEQH